MRKKTQGPNQSLPLDPPLLLPPLLLSLILLPVPQPDLLPSPLQEHSLVTVNRGSLNQHLTPIGSLDHSPSCNWTDPTPWTSWLDDFLLISSRVRGSHVLKKRKRRRKLVALDTNRRK
ncbi:hypothetical protein Tco_0889846 [Tanacetum coccineum]